MGLKDEDAPKVGAMEMEMLMKYPAKKNAIGAKVLRRIKHFIVLAQIMYLKMNRRVSSTVVGLLGLLLIKLLFFRHRGETLYVPPHLATHYGDVSSFYQLKSSQIDHWCLRGGDTACRCDDPTEELSRKEVPGWLATFNLNKKRAEDSQQKDIDGKFLALSALTQITELSHKVFNLFRVVVFYGDEIVQSWTGKSLTDSIAGGDQVSKFFNETFLKERGGLLNGLALGIAGDFTPNLLYRLQNGEMPMSLNPKLFWLLIGANDLVHGQCSEEAVVVGILRLADEIATKKPGSLVVIQGLLPRSSFADGALSHSRAKSTYVSNSHHREYYRPDRYPLWPSIKAINEELEKFCENHEHMIYFDASNLFLGSLGNEHFQSDEKVILKELMPDFVHPSVKGYTIWIKALGNALSRIVFDDDEENYQLAGN